MATVYVTTVNDDERDHRELCRLWRGLNGDGLAVRFDFSCCRFLRQNAVAFLGGLARLIESRGGCVEFDWNSLQASVAANLKQNGFTKTFGGPGHSWSGNSIPYLEHRVARAHMYADYLGSHWLGPGWIGISPPLSDAIVGTVSEAYVNVFDHADSPIGVFCCGQHYPQLGELKLTLVDFGVGIPSNVRLFKAKEFDAEQLKATNCMAWAFQNGTSTRPGGRGVGLDLLQAFVRKNGGRLEMFSHEGHALIADGKISFGERDIFFEGTLINISLRCDEKYYCFQSEIDDRPPF